ncbi:A-type potassium channel modulatory protein KCNIP1-like [Centruroides vittatus]|uniref:A-type potassium channel modulatory protein KCNIP1-like n=2 Tax=Centruroides TaxID=6875 RepID=UPI000C6D25E9|nr:Kv channel-interacting protein 1-like isoform X1 [Centruroides sculpturatus]XP_023232730.1 Kv channel-interacting protein 1-like isoform X1 [Centruroides sculpturatus]
MSVNDNAVIGQHDLSPVSDLGDLPWYIHLYTVMGAALSISNLSQRFIKFLRRALARRSNNELDDFDFNFVRFKPERIDALCKRTKFTRNELKLMYQGFKQACPTGIVNENAFKDIYASFFPQGDASLYAHYVFKLIDQEHNGTINFQDFVIGLSTISRGTDLEKLQWTFNLYDINGDGKITKEEMYEITTAIYLMLGQFTEPTVEEDTSKDHADRVFQKLDLNNDGVVTFDEFVDICLRDDNLIKSMNLLDTVM